MLTRGFLCLGLGLALAASSPAWAGSIACDPTPDPETGVPQCGWLISAQDDQGNVLGETSGTFLIEDDQGQNQDGQNGSQNGMGNVSLVGDPFLSGPGFSASIDDFVGDVDPEIVFGLGATNNTNAVAVFAFVFNLPLGGFGPPTIMAEAALGTTLTAPADANATVFPTLGVGKIVDSQDFDAAFNSFDKGVDIGDALTDPAGGLSTLRNEFVTSSILSGQGPFELMTVTVAFGLTDDSPTAGSGVGFSGRVTQIPEPGTIVLLGAGLFGLAWLRRQRA